MCRLAVRHRMWLVELMGSMLDKSEQCLLGSGSNIRRMMGPCLYHGEGWVSLSRCWRQGCGTAGVGSVWKSCCFSRRCFLTVAHWWLHNLKMESLCGRLGLQASGRLMAGHRQWPLALELAWTFFLRSFSPLSFSSLCPSVSPSLSERVSLRSSYWPDPPASA